MSDPTSKLPHLKLEALTSKSPTGHTSVVPGAESAFWVQVSMEIARCLRETDHTKHIFHIKNKGDPAVVEAIIEALPQVERRLWEPWLENDEPLGWKRRVPAEGGAP